MIPGEYILDGPELELNPNREVVTIKVNNTGDRPVQIGAPPSSRFHRHAQATRDATLTGDADN